MSIGKNIRTLRKAQGLTQEALGQQVGTTKQSISAWEDGKFVPNYDNLKKLAKALNVQLADLEATGKALDKKVKQLMTEGGEPGNITLYTPALAPFASYVRFVPVAARAGYMGGIPEPVFENQLLRAPLPVYLPNPDNFLAFEIDGDSMLPRIAEGDIVVCKNLPIAPTTSFKRHTLFVIVLNPGVETAEGGILCKQLERYDEKAQRLRFASLNPGYANPTFALSDIAQLWYVKHIIHVESL